MATKRSKTILNLKNIANPLKNLKWAVIKSFLAIVFYLIWILIGLFFLLIIFGQIKQGALNSILGNPGQNQQVTQQPQAEIPTETTLPGVGKVNIECVQNALDATAIQKIIEKGDASTLTKEEKS